MFAEKAKRVIAVDFMQKFLNKNMENNCKFNNIEYMCADVTKLELPERRYLFSIVLNYFDFSVLFFFSLGICCLVSSDKQII